MYGKLNSTSEHSVFEPWRKIGVDDEVGQTLEGMASNYWGIHTGVKCKEQHT